jgi:hypothetical protein
LKELTLPFIGRSATASGEDALLGILFGTGSNSKMQAVTQYCDANNYRTSYLPKEMEKLTITRPASQLGYGALYGCTMLKEVTIPSTVQGLGEKALYGCNGLTHIYSHWAFPPTAYDNTTFSSVIKFLCKLHVPVGSKQYYSVANGWKEFFSPVDNIEEEAAVTLIARSLPKYGGEIAGLL